MSNQRGRFSGRETGGRPPYPAGVLNGRVPLSLLGRCETQTQLGEAEGRYLERAAARDFDRMVRAAKGDGVTIQLVAGYRGLEGQKRMKAYWTARGKPGNAATPGTSNHGWGAALDLNRHLPGALDWLKAHATEYGFDSPMWAMDGQGTEEAWHWERIRFWQPPQEVRVLVGQVELTAADTFRDDGRLWVTLRPVVEALAGSITGFRGAGGDQEAEVSLGQREAWLPLSLHEGRGYSPARALESVGVSVAYDAGERTLSFAA